LFFLSCFWFLFGSTFPIFIFLFLHQNNMNNIRGSQIAFSQRPSSFVSLCREDN
jgi:hypothetical protein